MFDFTFFFNSVVLGVGLSMDAFSVSLANGLNEPNVTKRKTCLIAGVFAFFQALMPMIGWICVHTIVSYFTAFEKFIPWIALALLLFIGTKMIVESLRGGEEEQATKVGFSALLFQGIATSIDALSVGFTIAEYNFSAAFVAAIIIAAVTFCLCTLGVILGKKFGTKLAGKASVLGGVILILIGVEIFVLGMI